MLVCQAGQQAQPALPRRRGCAMGCAFCATGAADHLLLLQRNLRTGHACSATTDAHVTSVALMGQDELLSELRRHSASRDRPTPRWSWHYAARFHPGVIPMIAALPLKIEQFTCCATSLAASKTRDSSMPEYGYCSSPVKIQGRV